MYLYHGTFNVYYKHLVEEGANVQAGHDRTDFGQGFYVTENKQQAIDWAKLKAGRVKNEDIKPMVVTYKVDIDGLKSRFKFKNFGDSINKDILNCWIENRVIHSNINKKKYREYDIIRGLVADGKNLYNTLNDYQSGKIDLGGVEKNILYKKVQTQFCIKNQDVIDSPYFRYICTEIF